MRILIIDVNCKYSSTGNIVYSEYQYLKKKGHDVVVCYGRGPVLHESGIYKFGVDFETVFHAAMARVTGYNGCFSPLSTIRLIKTIDLFKPDVIHIHELHAYFVNINQLIQFIIRSQIPTVMTLHCEYNFTGKCGHANECMRFQDKCGNCPQLHDYPKSVFFDHTTRMIENKRSLFTRLDPFVTVPSKWGEERARLSFFHKMRIGIVHNGIDTNVFSICDSKERVFSKHGIAKDKKILLGVAPNIMCEEKGGRWMIDIARKLSPLVHLILIGADETVKNIENVSVIGRIDDQRELAEYYSAADVFLLCSKKETFSMTCAEALACGTPVVGFNAGAPETIFIQPFAYFSEYGKVDLILEKIEYRLSNPIDRSTIRRYAVSEFSQEKMCMEYENIYYSVVKNGVSNI